MQRQLQLFLVNKDESELSAQLVNHFPNLLFLNDNVWRELPDCRAGIQDCDSSRAYLYNGRVETLPVLRAPGRTTGPIAGCVIQILRSIRKGDLLLSGRIAIGIDDDDEQMLRFAKVVWKCVTRIGRIGVIRPDGIVDKHYLVGNHARNEVLDGTIGIADRSVGIHYRPLQ